MNGEYIYKGETAGREDEVYLCLILGRCVNFVVNDTNLRVFSEVFDLEWVLREQKHVR